MKTQDQIKKECPTLKDLFNSLRCGLNCDWTDLPIYGGVEPADTVHVWSWDSCSVMTGTCADDLEIQAR